MGSLLGGSFLSGGLGIANDIHQRLITDTLQNQKLNVSLPGPAAKEGSANDMIDDLEKNNVDSTLYGTFMKDRVDAQAFREYEDARMKSFSNRIKDGLKNKNITSDEMRELSKDCSSIINMRQIQTILSGKMPLEEREAMEKKMNELSKKIYAKKHNTEGVQRIDKPGKCKNKINSTTKEFREYMQTRYRMENLVIKDGTKDGKITKDELKDLSSKQKSLKEMERLFMKDDHLSEEERVKLMEEQDKFNSNIAGALHNNTA